MKQYPKPTVMQSIEAWQLMLDLIEVGYPHNFQNERSDLRNYCYDIADIIKRAYAIRNGEEHSA